MKYGVVLGMMLATGLPALALALPPVVQGTDVDTVRSGIGEEMLAPVVVKQPPAKPSATTVQVVVAVSDTAAVVDPFVVKGVVATLSNTTGFDRDAALEVAARQALPSVLTSLGHTPEKAAKSAKSVGSAMNFVKSYKVVKESLLPVYTLTADLTFNGPMVTKNFGGKVPVAKPDVVLAVSGTSVGTGGVAVDVDVPLAQNMPVKQWVVRIADRDPQAVDRVRTNLLQQPGTKATYRLLTSAGAELVVDTPMSSADINRYAGHSVEVMELEIPLPTAVVPVTGGATAGERPWQGQAEPSAPNTPSVPGTPNAPEGTY